MNAIQRFLQKLAILDTAPWSLPAMIVVTAGATLAGLYLKIPYLLPFLQAVVAWPFFAATCGQGRVARAGARILVFAAVAGVIVTAVVANAPRDEWSISVPRGASYRDEMFQFIRSGGVDGEEAHFLQYAPMHALHLGLFMILCGSTAGLTGLALGAALLDYMSYYVGDLVREAAAHGSVTRTLLVSWAPYAIVRVIAYAILGSGLTTWFFGPADARARAKGAILIGIALALVDMIAKHFLAHGYGKSLLMATGLK